MNQAFAPLASTGPYWPHLLYSDLDSDDTDMSDFNECRTARVAEVLADFRALQHMIASVNTYAPSHEEHVTPAWTLLRQCATDGRNILHCAADISFLVGQTDHEQQQLELSHILLDAYARRHEAQKIYLRQVAAQRCIMARRRIIEYSGGPKPSNQPQLYAIDVQLQQELQQITDEIVYVEMLSGDQSQGRWTVEDPGLYDVINWLRTRS